ncbi:GDA1/CD39 nucleoside phosphatase family protein [Actinidia rufa]|uniref:GDA1/CD39 nucleoside phosphatase family protein n=1 Tax=Actinidia rufa TaxID=165716 RepID=A0A7J0EBC6_9ERIC|nr:GDA1/CD39 nucleoside phosphatase family protein [Actinidia rufa]
MVFSRIVKIVSAAATRFSAPKSSALPYVSSGLSPPANYVHDYGFANSKLKNNLRLSSSLQDLSVYRHLDPEGGDFDSGSDASLIHAKQHHVLQRGNGGSSFSKEKASPRSPRVQKKWVRVFMVLLCLMLFAVLLFELQFYNSNWSQGKPKFYVVLDCGSTGTRVYVYQATINHKKDGSLPFLLRSLPEGFQRKPSLQSGRAYNRMETEPGFDKLVHNVSGLKGAIKPLIRWAEEQIPKHVHKTTALFLYATAGVRRLPSSDSQWLLEKAWSILKNSSFLCQREWIKSISGMEEAYYGWIALNYHTGILGTIPKNGNICHHLSAYSLSGYGLNDAFDKSVVHLLKRFLKITNADLASGNIEIKHPCLQSGYKEDYFCSQCASIYKGVGSPLSGGIGLGKGGKPGVPIHLIGAPKWEECRELAKVAVNLSECSDSTLDDVLEKGREFCEKTWDTAKNSVAPQPFIEQYCFRAPYIVFLLREGLHITERQVIIGSGSITWTLGAALFGSWEGIFNQSSASQHSNASSTSVLNIPTPFRFQCLSSGDGRVKMPRSPTVTDAQQRPFGTGLGFSGSSIHLSDSAMYPSTGSVFTQLFIWRSQSREDLNFALAEAHLAKV